MRENRTNRKQSSKLAEDLKNVLDNMSQEQFDKEWEKIENQGFPNVILLTGNEIIDELPIIKEINFWKKIKNKIKNFINKWK